MKIIKYIALSSFVILLTWACGNSDKKGNASSEEVNQRSDTDLVTLSEAQFSSSGMQLGSIEEVAIPRVIHVTGLIDVPPQNRAIVSAYQGGYIKEAPLLVGDYVRAGQKVITLENPDFVEIQQEYLETAEQLSYLRSEYERQQLLVAENISSEKNFLKAESAYKTALAVYNGLRKKLELLRIDPAAVEQGKISSTIVLYAPISGSVTAVNISKGMYVDPAKAILEIINTDHIHLELAVFEKDVMKIKRGQPISFTIPEASEQSYSAKVYLVGTSINNQNRTIKVHGHLSKEHANQFVVGMFVDAQITTDSTIVESLPEEAVVPLEDSAYVLVLSSRDKAHYTFKKMQVRAGTTSDGITEIDASPFSGNEQFLIKGSYDLLVRE